MHLINFLAMFIPNRQRRRAFREKMRIKRRAKIYQTARAAQAKLLPQLREKFARGEELRVIFITYDAPRFSAGKLFELMRAHEAFAPQIALLQAFSDYEIERAAADASAKTLAAKFGADALIAPSEAAFVAACESADVLVTCWPYDGDYPRACTLAQITSRALSYFVPYGYSGVDRFNDNLARESYFGCMWRCLVENPAWASTLAANGAAAEVVGCCKMDALADYPGAAQSEEGAAAGEEGDETAAKSPRRKRIIIAPHHSVAPKDAADESFISTSTFLRYAEFFIALARDFAEADFIFRPHPALARVLQLDGYFSAAEWEDYLARFGALANVRIELGGEFFATFAAADALIYDSIGFVCEFAYTGQPQCFLLRDEAVLEREFTPFGREVLARQTLARSEEDVRCFVRDVLAGRAARSEEAERFLRENVLINHPHASAAALKSILADLSARAK